MFNAKKKNHGWLPALIAGSAIVLSTTAFAGKNLIEERIVTPETAITLAAPAALDKYAVNANELSQELTSIINDPLRRKFYRDGIERLGYIKPELDKAAAKLGVPEQLLAVGLIESGYQDLPPQKGIFERSAGMWQIIARTANRLGLTVIPRNDERRDFSKSTDAALRYLAMNRALFNSWDLSVLAYNSGEKAVEDAIDKTGSHNPWVVRKALVPETRRYYVKWLAATILIQNPDLLKD